MMSDQQEKTPWIIENAKLKGTGIKSPHMGLYIEKVNKNAVRGNLQVVLDKIAQAF